MMEIKKLEKHEVSHFRDLVGIFKNVFESPEPIADQHALSGLLNNPDFLVFIVKIDSFVVGGLTTYILRSYYDVQPSAYIYDVAISSAFQGKGLGKALIAEVCSYCRENGLREAFVQADSEDVEAISFYRKTRYNNEMVAHHFTYGFGDGIE